MNLDHEDALRILVAMLAARPDGFTDGNRPPMYGLWIPRILEEFCRTNRRYKRRPESLPSRGVSGSLARIL